MVGDLAWFVVLLGSSVAAAHVYEGAITAVVLVVTLVGPPILRRIFPILRG